MRNWLSTRPTLNCSQRMNSVAVDTFRSPASSTSMLMILLRQVLNEIASRGCTSSFYHVWIFLDIDPFDNVSRPTGTAKTLRKLCFLLSESLIARAAKIAENGNICKVRCMTSKRYFFEVRGSAYRPYVCFVRDIFSSFCTCQDFRRKSISMEHGVLPMVRRLFKLFSLLWRKFVTVLARTHINSANTWWPSGLRSGWLNQTQEVPFDVATSLTSKLLLYCVILPTTAVAEVLIKMRVAHICK